MAAYRIFRLKADLPNTMTLLTFRRSKAFQGRWTQTALTAETVERQRDVVVKKIKIAALSVLMLYAAWVSVLVFGSMGPREDRLLYSVAYGLPLAIELAKSESKIAREFCINKVEKSKCNPVDSVKLISFLNNKNYKMNNSDASNNFIDQGQSIKTVIGNNICTTRAYSPNVVCSSAFFGIGPNGEELFLCSRRLGRCYFPELVGVNYPYG